MKRRAEEDRSSAKRSRPDQHPSVSSWMRQSSSSSSSSFQCTSSSATSAAGTMTTTDVHELYRKLRSAGLVQDPSSSAPSSSLSSLPQVSPTSTSAPSISTATRAGAVRAAAAGARAFEAGLPTGLMSPSPASCRIPSTSTSQAPSKSEGSTINVHSLYQQLFSAGLVSQEPNQQSPSSASQSIYSSSLMQSSSTPPSTQASSASVAAAATVVDVHKLYEQLSAAGLVQVPPAPKVQDLFDPAQLNCRRTNLIQQLYSGRQCKSCGIRFSSENSSKEYAEHLDWHFKQNQTTKKSSNHRKWYPTQDAWIRRGTVDKVEEVVEKESNVHPVEDSKSIDSLPASSTKVDTCNACQDRFELVWDDDEDTWCIKDGVEQGGALFHRSCL